MSGRLILVCLILSLSACAAAPPRSAAAVDKCKLINPAEAKYGDGC